MVKKARTAAEIEAGPSPEQIAINEAFTEKEREETIVVTIPPVHPNVRGGGGYGCYITVGPDDKFRFSGFTTKSAAIRTAMKQLRELRERAKKEEATAKSRPEKR